MKKKIASMLLSGIMIVTLVFGLVPTTVFGIEGVPEGYVPVYTAADLNNMRSDLTGKYFLMADIDLTGMTGSGAGWIPVGTRSTPFQGVLDGNGHSIAGLRINVVTNLSGDSLAGLFGVTSAASIKNLTLSSSISVVGTSTSGVGKVGAFVGESFGTTISNCTSNTAIYAENNWVMAGGFVGSANTVNFSPDQTVIEGCVSTGTVEGRGNLCYAGGLVGSAMNIRVNGSSNGAAVTGIATSWSNRTTAAAGVVGCAYTFAITDCRNSGAIKATTLPIDAPYATTAGGIVCENTVVSGPDDFQEISDCENTGFVLSAASSSSAAGIAGGVFDTMFDMNIEIERCANSGVVVADAWNFGYAAGITLGSNKGYLRQSYNTGRVCGTTYASGLVLFNRQGDISECYNIGEVEATGIDSAAGGLTYLNQDLIQNSYNLGFVRAAADVAGISTNNESAALINTSFNLGGLDSAGGTKGGIVARNSAMVIQSYYADAEANGVAVSYTDGLNQSVKLNAAQILLQTSYAGFDFGQSGTPGVWQKSAATGLPGLTNVEEVYIASLSVAGKPLKLSYLTNESVSTSGLVLKATLSNGNEMYLTKGFTLSAYSKAAGARNIVVNYAGKSTSFAVTFANFLAAPYHYAANLIKWSGSTGATAYKIYRATSATGTYTLIYTASASARSYVNSYLGTGKTYYYKIRPMYKTTSGALSSYAASKPVPTTPSVGASIADKHTATVVWSAVTGASGYELYRATSICGTYTLVKTTTATSHIDGSLNSATPYFYKVRAYHWEGTVKVYGLMSVAKRIIL